MYCDRRTLRGPLNPETNGQQAPVPLNIEIDQIRSNSNFAWNSYRCAFEHSWPIITKFGTRHDSRTVVTCTKFRYDRPTIIEIRGTRIFSKFWIRSNLSIRYLVGQTPGRWINNTVETSGGYQHLVVDLWTRMLVQYSIRQLAIKKESQETAAKCWCENDSIDMKLGRRIGSKVCRISKPPCNGQIHCCLDIIWDTILGLLYSLLIQFLTPSSLGADTQLLPCQAHFVD